MSDMTLAHQSQLAPEANKFHVGNGSDRKHYWLTPVKLYAQLDNEFQFNFDPCPFPKPDEFDGLTCEWGESNYVNPPFGSIMHEGKKKGPTAWARKAILEHQKGKSVVLVYPIDKWVLMLLAAGAKVRNLGDVRWVATEDGSEGKGTGRHIACFVLDQEDNTRAPSATSAGVDEVARDAARYRHICASLMTDVDGMFSVEYRRDADTDECFFGKDELDEVVDASIQSAARADVS